MVGQGLKYRDDYRNATFHPQVFLMWLGLVSIAMLFAGLISAYIVRQSAGNWLEFPLPHIFIISTLTIVMSSATLAWAYRSYLRGWQRSYRQGLLLTFFLGVAFLVMQYYGWSELYSKGIGISGNPAGSFLYVLTGLHALHLIGGLFALVVIVYQAWWRHVQMSQQQVIRLKIISYYWHFLMILWIVLYGFLYFTR